MITQVKNKFILPTPAGAYYCISSNKEEPAKLFLQNLMLADESIHFDASGNISGNDEEVLYHIKKLKLLQSFDNAISLAAGTIEETLPIVLKKLSSDGKALLADDQGLCLTSVGYTHEAAEEISALSGDLSSLYIRHQGIIRGNLNIQSSAFSIVDAAGYSQIGFWPLYIGGLMFVLVVSGVPRFDQSAFVDLIWSLHKRYFTHDSSVDSDAA